MTKFHVNKNGEAGLCSASLRSCPLGGEDKHFDSLTEARNAVEKELSEVYGAGSLKKERLVVKNGVEVVEGKIAVGDFARSFNTKESINGYYEGSWEQLNALVKKHWDDNEPGAGSVDGDVLLVNVPKEGFYTNVVEITPENEASIITEEWVRQSGEKPVIARYLVGDKPPASYVQVVVYRADVLAQDNDRTTNAEWEIVAILANKDKVTPMDPTTMARNTNHEEGGTFREYSQKEWADAEAYWSRHAYIKPVQNDNA